MQRIIFVSCPKYRIRTALGVTRRNLMQEGANQLKQLGKILCESGIHVNRFCTGDCFGETMVNTICLALRGTAKSFRSEAFRVEQLELPGLLPETQENLEAIKREGWKVGVALRVSQRARNIRSHLQKFLSSTFEDMKQRDEEVIVVASYLGFMELAASPDTPYDKLGEAGIVCYIRDDEKRVYSTYVPEAATCRRLTLQIPPGAEPCF